MASEADAAAQNQHPNISEQHIYHVISLHGVPNHHAQPPIPLMVHIMSPQKKEHDVNACSVLPCQNDITVVRERTTRDLTTTTATGILHSYRQVVMGPNIVFND